VCLVVAGGGVRRQPGPADGVAGTLLRGRIANVGRRLANQGFGPQVRDTARTLVESDTVGTNPMTPVAMAHVSHIFHLGGERVIAEGMVGRAVVLATRIADPAIEGVVMARRAALVSETEGSSESALATLERAIDLLEQAEVAPADAVPAHLLGAFREYFNMAVLAAQAKSYDVVEDYAQRLATFETSHHGVTSGGTEMIRGGLAMQRGDLETAARSFSDAARRHESAHFTFHAQDMWSSAALVLALAGHTAEARGALETAASLRLPLDHRSVWVAAAQVRLAHAEEHYGAVLEIAERWLRDHPSAEGPTHRGWVDRESLVRGFGMFPSRFVALLYGVCDAAWRVDGHPIACRIAGAARELLAETPYERWDTIGETEHWRELADRCGAVESPLTLSEAYDLVFEMLGVDGPGVGSEPT
jgi:tetratricopeptide (TPR) repeat protein